MRNLSPLERPLTRLVQLTVACVPAAAPSWVMLAVMLSGCAGPLTRLAYRRDVPTSRASFELRWGPEDESEQARVEASLRRVALRFPPWARPRASLAVLLLPSHEALEAATGQRHWAWLRAWAQFDRVLLQAPRTWAGRADDQLDELLLHELTHCLMYQRSATSDTWLRKRVPLWFREGLATVTADQGYRYPTLEAVAVWASEAQQSDLFGQAEALARRSSDLVYGFAHHALRFLVRRYGEESPVHLMDALASGLDFPDAFAAATGLSVARYEREFLNYLRLRGFRGAGLLTKHPSALPAAAPPPPPP